MKLVVVLGLIIALLGCTSTNYSNFEIGKAELSNIEVEENFTLKLREHKITASFDYSISAFQAGYDLYHCTIQFLSVDGNSLSQYAGTKTPCKIDAPSGHITVTWPAPIDKSANFSDEMLTQVKYPIEYFVAIHQKTDHRSTRIIGRSPNRTSEIKK